MNILVISPHPDDEILGAGGTLLKHKEQGDKIFWCIITNMKPEYGYDIDKVNIRNKEIEKVADLLGVNELFNFEFPPTKLNSTHIPKLIEKLAIVINKITPHYLYIPYFNDAHSDHRITFETIKPFLKSFRYPFIKKVLMMEIISETDQILYSNFIPNIFVDITKFIDKKLEIMKVYNSELGNHPFPRNLANIKSLAMYRGSQCNFDYAEAFMLLKEVIE